MPKGFYTVSKTKWHKIEKAIWEKDNVLVDKLLEKAPFSIINPMQQAGVANGLLYDGNIIIEKPSK